LSLAGLFVLVKGLGIIEQRMVVLSRGKKEKKKIVSSVLAYKNNDELLYVLLPEASSESADLTLLDGQNSKRALRLSKRSCGNGLVVDAGYRKKNQ